jgi:hypothetical protein
VSTTTTEPTTQTGAEPGTNNGGQTGGAPVAQPQTGNDDKTFSQQAVNALIGARLKEARQQWEKEQKDAAETAEAEKRGEYEKVLAKERERAEKAEQKATDVERTANERVIKGEIRSVATELHFADPADAYRFINLDDVALDQATGEPTNVRQLLSDLIDPKKGNKAYLVGGAGQQNGNRQPIPGTPNASQITLDEFKQQEKERALRSGKYSAL